MVKIIAGALAALFLMSAAAAYAGDLPESIMSGDNLAMFIGQIIKIKTDTIIIKPLTVMMGNVVEGELEVKRFESYSMEPHDPRKGDYIIALLIDETTIDETWVFECTGADYKTLKIVANWKHDMVRRYEELINDGAYLEAQKRLDEKENDPTAESTAEPVAALNAAATTPPASASSEQIRPAADLKAVAASGGNSNQALPIDQNTLIIFVLAAVMLSAFVLGVLVNLRRKRI